MGLFIALFEEKAMFDVEPVSVHGQVDRAPRMPLLDLFTRENTVASYRVEHLTHVDSTFTASVRLAK